MIASVDGGTSLKGTSGALGGAADHEVFATLRSFADVILVGAGTLRAERYGPARLDEPHRQARVARGQPPVPPIAVLTRSADLDWSTPFFADAEARPVVVTVEHAGDQLRHAADVAEVIIAGDDHVDLRRAIDELAIHGWGNILVEGGPSINAELAVLDAIDELCLTISPTMLGGTSARVLRDGTPDPPPTLRVASILTSGDYLFLRYARTDTRPS
jgi:riboflavin biosynthesis pyrimidine reductase